MSSTICCNCYCNLKLQLEEFQKKHAMILQKQLSSLSQAKQQEIYDLNRVISSLQTNITKLQTRNALDRKNERELQQKSAEQEERIKKLTLELHLAQSKKEIVQKQIVREVIIKVPQSISNKLQNDAIIEENIKLKGKISEFQNLNQFNQTKALRDIDNQDKMVNQLKSTIEELQAIIEAKNIEITNHTDNIKYLQEKNYLLSKPFSHKLEPVVLHHLQHQPSKLQTIYIDRPVIKNNVIEVEKLVKHLIQPKQAIVNKIIQCRQKNDNIESYDQCYEECHRISQNYDNLIGQYKAERQNLVKEIAERDNDHRQELRRIELLKIMNKKPNKSSLENVQVTIQKQPLLSEREQKQLKNIMEEQQGKKSKKKKK